jgi:hypothetical protein
MRLKVIVTGCLLALILGGWILLGRSKRLGYIDSAIGSVRILIAGQVKYAEAHPQLGYTCSLSALPSDGLAADLVKNGESNEYVFEISGCPLGVRNSPNWQYTLTARPLLGGMPAFCSDQSGVVKYDDSGSTKKCLTNGVPVG